MNIEIEKPEKSILTGDIPLTPVHKWFFEKKWNNIHHFNQSVLLEIKKNISLHMLKSIFNVIVQYHDVFRVKYKLVNGMYMKSYTNNLSTNIEERILKSANKEEFLEEICENATTVQGSLNIFEGPVFRVVLYRCPDRKDRILVVAHHLVVDGVSWRILMDDMETIYDAFMQTGKISLPAKTYSYRQWGNALMNYAKSESSQTEATFWKEEENFIKETFLTPDSRDSRKGNDYLTMSLNKEETADLIYRVPKKYDAQINDILLTALVLAAGDISNNYEFSFTLEGHGREDIIGLDVSRTIGWFTSIFPVFLKITDPNDLINSMNEVKASLRMIPHKGIGYGIIRYYTDKLRKPLPRVSFNYLGQWDAGISKEGVFQYAKESFGEGGDRENESYNLIDMNGGIKYSIFKMNFTYRVDFYKSETIEKFANQFKKRLLEVIIN